MPSWPASGVGGRDEYTALVGSHAGEVFYVDGEMEMTKLKMAPLRAFGWLADVLFPGCFFFSWGRLGEGIEPLQSDPNCARANMAAAFIMQSMHACPSPGDSVTCTLKGIEDGGRTIGDFKVQIERLT